MAAPVPATISFVLSKLLSRPASHLLYHSLVMCHFGEIAGKRTLWIDFAKTIGIWLVILGHIEIPAFMEKFIFAFYMPLFFFISGYLEKDVRTMEETIINGIKTLGHL